MRDFYLNFTSKGKPRIKFPTGEEVILSGELINNHTFLANPEGIDDLDCFTPTEKQAIKETITARTVNDDVRIAFPFTSKN